MAKPLRLILDFLCYEGVAPTNNPQDEIAVKRKVEESNVSEVARFQKVIPGTTSDLSLSLADAANDYLLMLVDQQVSIKLNGSADAITLNPKGAGIKTPVFLVRGSISSLSITNAGSNAANIDFVSVKL